jgi:dihydrodipicolinate synthase/N-acetylneuraminate lyase
MSSSAIAGSGGQDGGGFYSYLATPYDEDGEIELGVLGEYAQEIAASGVTGITCLASTCEGPYLTDDEWEKVAGAVGRAVSGRVRLAIGVGALSTRQAILKAQVARDAGATCLLLEMQQFFPVTFEAAYRHYESIAAAVPLPIRLYNLPVPTHFDFTPERIAMMGAIGAIHSVKEASGDVTRIRDITALCGTRFKIHCGFHFQALEGMRLGAAGWEVMLHPAIARACIGLYDALRADPWSPQAEARFRELQPMFVFFRQCGVPQSIKALSEMTGLKLGRPRAPYAELSLQQKARLRQIVVDLALL